MPDPVPFPPIDRELQETIWRPIVDDFVPLTRNGIPALRDRLLGDLGRLDDHLATWADRIQVDRRPVTLPPDGRSLPARILRPAGRTDALPCLYYTANAGKIVQHPLSSLTAQEFGWVADLGVALVSIAPRVGPEFPHPAQIDDAYGGLVWLDEHADRLGIDRTRIMVYGKSGGGGIAAATALMARDRGGPTLRNQILVYPMLDDRELWPSSAFDQPTWPRGNNRVGWEAILGDARGTADVSPYAAPARAIDLRGLPPAYIEVGGSEVFRDEDVDYAVRLAHAGVPTELHVWAGGFHGSEKRAPDSDIGHATTVARTSYLRRALRSLVGEGG